MRAQHLRLLEFWEFSVWVGFTSPGMLSNKLVKFLEEAIDWLAFEKASIKKSGFIAGVPDKTDAAAVKSGVCSNAWGWFCCCNCCWRASACCAINCCECWRSMVASGIGILGLSISERFLSPLRERRDRDLLRRRLSRERLRRWRSLDLTKTREM